MKSFAKILKTPTSSLKVMTVGTLRLSTRVLHKVLTQVYEKISYRLVEAGISPWAFYIFAGWAINDSFNLVEKLHQNTPISIMSVGALSLSTLAAGLAVDRFWKVGKGIRFSDLNPKSFHNIAMKAIENGDIETLEYLESQKPRDWNWKSLPSKGIKNKDIPVSSPLIMAVLNKENTIVTFLLNKKLKLHIPKSDYQDEALRLNRKEEAKKRRKIISKQQKIYSDFYTLSNLTSDDNYQLFFEKMTQNSNFSIEVGLDSLISRHFKKASMGHLSNSSIETFLKYKDLFESQKLKKAFEKLKTIKPEIVEDESFQSLFKTFQSHIEKNTLEKTVPLAEHKLSPNKTRRL